MLEITNLEFYPSSYHPGVKMADEIGHANFFSECLIWQSSICMSYVLKNPDSNSAHPLIHQMALGSYL